jgi:hypothetical protein
MGLFSVITKTEYKFEGMTGKPTTLINKHNKKAA